MVLLEKIPLTPVLSHIHRPLSIRGGRATMVDVDFCAHQEEGALPPC